MAPDLTIVIPVRDQHTQLLPRCLAAIHNEAVVTELVVVDNASRIPLEPPPRARSIHAPHPPTA